MPAKRVGREAHEVNKLAKNKAFLRDLVEVLPFFTNMTKAQRKAAIDNAAWYNIEAMFEDALAHLGGYTRVDGSGYDFSDGSEAKTASVQLRPMTGSGNSHKGEITNVGSVLTGKLKNGAIRLAVYIAPRDEVRYYYLPKRYWSKLNIRPSAAGLRIVFTYNWATNSIAKFDFYRVMSLKALAEAKG
jgi:hypothetical protein